MNIEVAKKARKALLDSNISIFNIRRNIPRYSELLEGLSKCDGLKKGIDVTIDLSGRHIPVIYFDKLMYYIEDNRKGLNYVCYLLSLR